jgi:hypothetical protein
MFHKSSYTNDFDAMDFSNDEQKKINMHVEHVHAK